MKRLSVVLLCALLASWSCKGEKNEPKLVATAKFGIFYGGQVQERAELPFELDRAKQTQGIRIVFRKPLERDLRVSWELGMPVFKRSRRAKDSEPPDRIVKVGETLARAGQERLDVVFPFKPGEPLGVWHIRAKVGDDVVIDRDFTVYDRAARARQHADAGLLIP